MKNMFKTLFAVAVLSAAVSLADEPLVDTPTSLTGSKKLQAWDVDTGWVQRDNGDVATDGSWSIDAGGDLTNSGDGESGAYLVQTVSSEDTSLTHVTIRFDYTVKSGTALYFYANVLTGLPDSFKLTLTKQDGLANNVGLVNNVDSAFNLKDGRAPDENDSSSALIELTGNGSFSMTYDISDFMGIDSIADIDALMAAFTTNGEGMASVSNVTIAAVQEPATFGWVGLSALIALFVYKLRA